MSRTSAQDVQRWIESETVKRLAQHEEACEMAMLGGKHGVLADGTRSRVDERVPYGTAVHLPWYVTLDDVDAGRFEVQP